MTTAGDLIQRILHPLRDLAQDFFPNPELIDYLNQSVVDLAARQRLLRKAVNITTSGGTLPMSDDMLQVRWVRDVNGVELGWVDESTFFEYELVFPGGMPGEPLATIYADAIWLQPQPDDGEVWTVGYYGVPDPMTIAEDTYPLRRIWEEKSVRYVRSECWYKLGEPQMGDRERSFYEEGLRPAEAVTDHQVPGRMSFAREPNVFDTHSESIHLGG
jgi:hypothetical protein